MFKKIAYFKAVLEKSEQNLQCFIKLYLWFKSCYSNTQKIWPFLLFENVAFFQSA